MPKGVEHKELDERLDKETGGESSFDAERR